jgi:hypothetical protein
MGMRARRGLPSATLRGNERREACVGGTVRNRSLVAVADENRMSFVRHPDDASSIRDRSSSEERARIRSFRECVEIDHREEKSAKHGIEIAIALRSMPRFLELFGGGVYAVYLGTVCSLCVGGSRRLSR